MSDMTQEEMMGLIAENRAEITVLENEINGWKENYVRLNRKFQDGDEVVLYNGNTGYIYSCSFEEYGPISNSPGIYYNVRDDTDGSWLGYRDFNECELTKTEIK